MRPVRPVYRPCIVSRRVMLRPRVPETISGHYERRRLQELAPNAPSLDCIIPTNRTMLEAPTFKVYVMPTLDDMEKQGKDSSLPKRLNAGTLYCGISSPYLPPLIDYYAEYREMELLVTLASRMREPYIVIPITRVRQWISCWETGLSSTLERYGEITSKEADAHLWGCSMPHIG